jgi:hypothetical protein
MYEAKTEHYFKISLNFFLSFSTGCLRAWETSLAEGDF